MWNGIIIDEESETIFIKDSLELGKLAAFLCGLFPDHNYTIIITDD